MKSKVFIQKQSAITIQDVMNSPSRYIHFDRLGETWSLLFQGSKFDFIDNSKIPAAV